MSLRFEILYQSKRSRARVGRIHTTHGIIDTPNFVGVGTNGTMKALDTILVDELGMQLMFCNTYHLILQPGTEIIKQAGGLHRFIGRTKPIITDSGGFQVFSLAYGTVKDELKSKGKKTVNNAVLSITEKGVWFRSYRNGDKILLTPETSIQAQKNLGADIIIPFDELPPYHISHKKLVESLHRTHRWEERSLNEHLKNKNNQSIYAVIHGGIDLELRALSCKTLTTLPFDGYAIGGSLGKTKDEMLTMLSATMLHLPSEKPTHLLGIGDLASLGPSIAQGLDTFDSSHPTKCARHGLFFTAQGDLKISHAKHKSAFEPIDSTCSCHTCRFYTRAYLHHLFKAHEPTAHTLATIHNLAHMIRLMEYYRQSILNGEI